MALTPAGQPPRQHTTCPEGHVSASLDYCDTCGLAIAEDAADSATPDLDATSPGMAAVPPAGQECPHCSAQNPPDALFCEACGYDYTTGTMPRPVEPLSFPVPASLADPGRRMPSEPVRHERADPAGPGANPVAEPADPAPSAPSDAPSDPLADPPSVPLADPAGESPAPALDQPWVAEVWIDPDWYADQGSSDRMPSPGLPSVVLLRHTSSLVGRASRSRGIAPEVDVSADPGVSRRHAQLTTDGTRWFVEDLGSANGTYVGAAAQSLPRDPIPAGEKREVASGEQVYLGAWTRIVIRKAAEGEF